MIYDTFDRPSNLDTNRSWFVIKHDDFLHLGKEQICKFNMGRMSYILRHTLHTLKGRLEYMGETLMQVLGAHVISPDYKTLTNN